MIIIYVLIVVVLIVMVAFFDYKLFISKRMKEINNLKQIETKYGLVEYIDIGKQDDPPVLFCTGGGAGIDSIYAFDWFVDHGFRMIAVNRPGYYNCKIENKGSIELHADIYHEVLTELDVEMPHVFGISMGGVSALYYASKYKAKSLVLWSAVTGKYTVQEDSADTALGKMVLSPKGKKLVSWLLYRSAQLMPRLTQKEFIKPEADLDNKTINHITRQTMADPVAKKEFLIFARSMTPMDMIFNGMMEEVDMTLKEFHVDWNRITMPLMAYFSPQDKDVTMDHSQRLIDKVDGADIRYVKACGHYVWWGDERSEVIKGTLDFFKKVDGL